MSDEDGVPVVERLTAEQVRAICHAYRVPLWVAGLAPRPSWPARVRHWLRGERP